MIRATLIFVFCFCVSNCYSMTLNEIETNIKKNNCIEMRRFKIASKISDKKFEVKYKKPVFSQRGFAWATAVLITKNKTFTSTGMVYELIAIQKKGTEKMKMNNGFEKDIPVWEESATCARWFALYSSKIKEEHEKEEAKERQEYEKRKQEKKAMKKIKIKKREKFNELFE